MEERLLDIEQLNDLLQQWCGQKIRILKQEMDDIDEIILDLHVVTYAKGSSIDNYIPRYSLRLNGSGVIGTTMNNYEALPSEMFEIPLEEEDMYEYDGNRFVISTSRGVYVIKRSE